LTRGRATGTIRRMNEVAARAAGAAKSAGAGYADARAIEERWESIATKNGEIVGLDRTETIGVGVRALVDGAWGFAATSDLSNEKVDAAAREAVAIARASGRVQAAKTRLAEQEPFVARYETPYVVDAFRVSLDEKIRTLLKVDAALKAVKGVSISRASMTFREKRQFFASSAGAAIEQVIRWAGAGCAAMAVGKDDAQERSYPASFGGQHAAGGYEVVVGLRLLENAPRVGEEAVALLAAPQCPAATRDLVLGSSQVALQVHESCGHPVELDRVLGYEANYAGTSFLTLDRWKSGYRYGSPAVNIVADSLAPGGLGTFGFDDEGAPAQRWDLVREGVHKGYLTSRETAPLLGLGRSQGTMRASGYNRIPLVRMTNVSLEPGPDLTLDELIADTKDGVFMDVNRSWSIDQQRYNFQFVCEAGWEIKDGKRVGLVKNPSYQGITPEFWGSCDRVCGLSEWILWGVPNCGKGEPGQTMGTGHGAAPARFRGVKIGAAYADR
jgi:TldD protein